jgi:hypothetical protein
MARTPGRYRRYARSTHVTTEMDPSDLSSEATDAERASYQRKLRAIRQAQQSGTVYDGIAAADLLAMTMRLATSWLGAPAALKLAAGKDPNSPTRLRNHRKALAEAVGRLAAPR